MSVLLGLLAAVHHQPVEAISILVVGATGTTGIRAIQGLLDVGWKATQIRLVTRDVNKPNICHLRDDFGFDVVQADLEVPLTLEGVSNGCTGCYIHSTSSDTPELDLKEVERAQNLCAALSEQNSVRHVVYNSAASLPTCAVKRVHQKHGVEKVFQQSSLSFTSLRANLFMEELWKPYTRPNILKGKYPLPANRKKGLYLTSVRDMGRLAGKILMEDESSSQVSATINVASDYLTGLEIAQAYSKAQRTNCNYIRPRLMEWKAWFQNPELHGQILFIQKDTEVTDISKLKKQYPNMLTSFADFLSETHWGDEERAFADFAQPSSLEVVTQRYGVIQ